MRTRADAIPDTTTVTRKLLEYCRSQGWAGYDPYDALNSPLLTSLPFLQARVPRLLLTQAFKRSPINIRPLARIPRTQNPKAIALFLIAVLRLTKLGALEDDTLAPLLTARLAALRSPDARYWCWGYSFPWQTRTQVIAKGSPNLVCTAFAGAALLDAYEATRDESCLQMAISAADYVLDCLYWNDGGSAGFSYPQPSLRLHIHNANFLGAAFLCRVYTLTGERRFLEPALTAARYSAWRQRADGSWPYGETRTQQWIDNFHTGYNLCALRSIARDAFTPEFDECVRRGFEFYRDHFIREDGAARYYHDRTYPIDIHSVAQTVITLCTLRDLDPRAVCLARTVFQWAVRHMRDERGFFYYRVLRFGTIRTPYLRWAQAWMLLAGSILLGEDAAADHVGAAAREVA